MRACTLHQRLAILALWLVPFSALAAAEPPRLSWPAVEARLAQDNGRLTPKNSAAADKTFRVVCTLYYTPCESGITADRGFDVTPETAPGLSAAGAGKRRFARDFLRAVHLEGFGRLQSPINGQNYLHYEGGGRFGLARQPTGRGGTHPLVARHSCAVRGGSGAPLQPGEIWRLESPEIHAAFFPETPASEAGLWTIADTGGGLHRWQLDLYWGDDDPRGPGADLSRPRSSDFQWALARARRTGG